MKTLLKRLACSACIVFACCGLLFAQGTRPGAEKPAPPARGGIFTLYGLDPQARALCFRVGRERSCSDLSFTLAGNGSLVSGIESDRTASIIDLGTADELRERYGYEDAVGGGEGFASLQLQSKGSRLMILKENKGTLQPLKEGPSLFSSAGPSATAPIKLGHIYLVRIADKKDHSFQTIVKLMVIAYRPDESVTVRWELL